MNIICVNRIYLVLPIILVCTLIVYFGPKQVAILFILLFILALFTIKIEIGLLTLLFLNPFNAVITNIYSMFLSVSSGIWNDLFIAFLLIAMIIRKIVRKENFTYAEPNRAIFIYIFYLFSLLFFHPGPGGIGSAILALRYFIEPIIAYFLVINIIKDIQHIRLSIALLLIGAIILALEAINEIYIFSNPLIGIFSPLGSKAYYQIGARATAGVDPNDFAYYLDFIIVIVMGLLISIPFNRKYFFIPIVPFLIFGVLLTASRGGVMALATGIMTLFVVPSFIPKFSLNVKKFVMFISFVVIILLSFNVLSKTAGVVYTRLANTSIDSDARKQIIISYLTTVIPKSPIIGFGLSSVGNIKYGSVWRKVEQSSVGEVYRDVTHNDYLRITVETGFIGLLIYLWVMGIFLKMSFRLYAKLHNNFYKGLCLGIVGFYVVFITAGMTQNVSENQILGFFFWFIGGIVVALHDILTKQLDSNLNSDIKYLTKI